MGEELSGVSNDSMTQLFFTFFLFLFLQLDKFFRPFYMHLFLNG